MTPNTKRFVAFIAMIIGFTAAHFGFWWWTLMSTTVGPNMLLSLPIAFPVMGCFAFADWPDGALVALGIANSAFWGVGLAILVLRIEHVHWFKSHSIPSECESEPDRHNS